MNNAGRSAISGMAGTFFLIGLVLAIVWNPFNLPVFFAGLAFSALFGSLGSGQAKGAYGGLYGFVWFMALASFFVFHHWVVFLIAAIVSGMLGSMANSILSSFSGMRMFSNQPMYTPQSQQAPETPYYQPSQPQQQPPAPTYQPYQEGYQPPQQQATYQEGGQPHPYPSSSQVQDYEQPQAQYPQQPLPPQQ